MKKALERFKEVFFYPPVRHYKMPRPDIVIPRYPAPGSEPIDHKENRHDYKTAYRDSIHSIRYDEDIHHQL